VQDTYHSMPRQKSPRRNPMTITSSAPNTHSPDHEVLPLDDARARLTQMVSSLAIGSAPNRVHRFEVEVEAVDPLVWLAAQRAGQRFSFRPRDGRWSTAGVGSALRRNDWSDPAVRQLLASHAMLEARGMS